MMDERQGDLKQYDNPRNISISPYNSFYHLPSSPFHHTRKTPFHHITINENVPPKNDSPSEHFTISRCHHFNISAPKNWFTIGPFQHLENNTKIMAQFNQKIILNYSNDPSISPFHRIMISQFHRGATNVNLCSIIQKRSDKVKNVKR